MTEVNFDKVSFRTTTEEAEYLQELAHRYGANSITDFMHQFLTDCRKTNVGNVRIKRVDDDGYRSSNRLTRENRSDSTDSHPDSGHINRVLEIVNQAQYAKIRELQEMVRQQDTVMTQQREYISYLQQMQMPLYFDASGSVGNTNRNPHDTMSMFTSELDKTAKLVQAVDNLRGW